MTRAYLATSIHGREEALATLTAALDEEGPRTVLLVGEAGIGKSRLAGWAAERAEDAGRVVVAGRAVLGFSEALGVLCDTVRSARRDGLAPREGFPAMLLPELGGGAGPESLGAVYEGAAVYLRALAGHRGVLLVLEDLHWADPASLRLVPFLARTLAGDRVALVVTTRPDDGTAPVLGEVRDALTRAGTAVEIPLGPLAPDAARAMLAEILGGQPAGAVEAELLRLAGGNPFALEELARAAGESGWLDDQAGSGRSLELPFTLTDAIRARAAALDPADRELIAWAAVLGERFDARALRALAGADLGPGLARLSAAGLIAADVADPTGHGYGFRHALVWEVIAAEGLTARRRARHARVLAAADGMAAAGAPMSAAELAAHALAAGDAPATIAHSREAAERAVSLGASLEAAAHLERALSFWPADGDRAERAGLLRECGRLRSRASRSDERSLPALEEALAEFTALGDEREAAWTRALVANARYEAGDDETASEEWGRALAVLRREPSPALRSALVGLARAHALAGRTTEAVAVADEGLGLGERDGDTRAPFDQVNLLITRGMAVYISGDPRGRADVEAALALATAIHDDLGAARGHHILASTWEDDLAAAVQHLATARELVTRHGMLVPQAFYATAGAWLLCDNGRPDEARRWADEADGLLAATPADEWTRGNLMHARTTIALARGELEAADAMATEMLDLPWIRRDPMDRADTICTRARCLHLLGRPDDAQAALDQVMAALGAISGDVVIHLLPATVTVAVARGRLEDARALAARRPEVTLRPFLRDGARALAALDAAGVEAAAARADAAGARLEGAVMRISAAQALAAGPGRREDAAALARAAHARFRHMGSEAWCRRIEGFLRGLGERASTPHAAGAGGLSARELEVLGLVAEGLTNRQIAERLQVTQHTAIRHVANIMAKLGARSRAAAVRIAAERGILRAGESA